MNKWVTKYSVVCHCVYVCVCLCNSLILDKCSDNVPLELSQIDAVKMYGKVVKLQSDWNEM